MVVLRFCSAVSIAAFATLVACSSTTTTPGADASVENDASVEPGNDSGTTPTDASTTKDTGTNTCTPTADAGAACNTMVNTASVVALSTSTDPLPTGTGGTIADGHYVLTELKAYKGAAFQPGITFKQTLELCSGIGQFVSSDSGKPEYHKSFSYAPNGINPNVTQTCSSQSPNVDVPYTSYTATATTLTLFSSQLIFSVTYTKQ
ncbi:MAG: hypothetical protein U0174_24535 [Polyangiaceae bacterium]